MSHWLANPLEAPQSLQETLGRKAAPGTHYQRATESLPSAPGRNGDVGDPLGQVHRRIDRRPSRDCHYLTGDTGALPGGESPGRFAPRMIVSS